MILLILAISLLASGAFGDTSYHHVYTRNMYSSNQYASQAWLIYPCESQNDPYGEWVYVNNRAQYVHVADCHYYSDYSCISSTRHIGFESGRVLYVKSIDNCWQQNCKQTCLRNRCFPSSVTEPIVYVIKQNITTPAPPVIHVVHSTPSTTKSKPTTTTTEPTTTSEPTTTTPKPTRATITFTTTMPPLIHATPASSTPKPTIVSKEIDDEVENVINEYFSLKKTPIVKKLSNLEVSSETPPTEIDDEDEVENVINEYFSLTKRPIVKKLSNLEVSSETPPTRYVYVPKCRDQFGCDPLIMNRIIYGQIPSSSSASSSASASGSSASASASASAGSSSSSSSSSSASSPYISYPSFSYQYQPCQPQIQYGYVVNPCTVN